VVGAGAVVSPNFHLPSRRMALGVPARIREGYEVPDRTDSGASDHYVQNAKWHRTELRRLS
jgi:carbonic anhydrase/acetyltransferase-like protein (isoleucine patch superfamily)